MDVLKWSEFPNRNGDIDSNINWLEGIQPPSSVNLSARATMAGVAEFVQALGSYVKAKYVKADGTTKYKNKIYFELNRDLDMLELDNTLTTIVFDFGDLKINSTNYWQPVGLILRKLGQVVGEGYLDLMDVEWGSEAVRLYEILPMVPYKVYFKSRNYAFGSLVGFPYLAKKLDETIKVRRDKTTEFSDRTERELFETVEMAHGFEAGSDSTTGQVQVDSSVKIRGNFNKNIITAKDNAPSDWATRSDLYITGVATWVNSADEEEVPLLKHNSGVGIYATSNYVVEETKTEKGRDIKLKKIVGGSVEFVETLSDWAPSFSKYTVLDKIATGTGVAANTRLRKLDDLKGRTAGVVKWPYGTIKQIESHRCYISAYAKGRKGS